VTVDLSKAEKADEGLTEIPEIVDDLQTPDPTGSAGQAGDDA
jgi:hypothetical protein